ncbi:hypothetical protein ANANG_G00033110 [Anguilla anguilla]|uniref:Uncharacterized protein n=1 Tax=Anguilla anguilla TaxID=7936 RepID=A0A9D3S447_ANGAN|nr:hypothetical protein ANANG_G00033110 [Anguilla anguilla]
MGAQGQDWRRDREGDLCAGESVHDGALDGFTRGGDGFTAPAGPSIPLLSGPAHIGPVCPRRGRNAGSGALVMGSILRELAPESQARSPRKPVYTVNLSPGPSVRALVPAASHPTAPRHFLSLRSHPRPDHTQTEVALFINKQEAENVSFLELEIRGTFKIV